MLRAFLIMWTAGAGLAALGVLYVADWRPELAPDNKAVAPSSTASGSTASRRSVRNEASEVADPDTTGSVEPARRRSADAPRPSYTDQPNQSTTVADARQARRVGPPAVLLPSAPQDKAEKPAVAAREAVADKAAAKPTDAEALITKGAGPAEPPNARTGRGAPSSVAAAAPIVPMEDFEASPASRRPDASAAAPRVAPAKESTTAPSRANAGPDTDTDRETRPTVSPLLRTAAVPRRAMPQIDERPSASEGPQSEESAAEVSAGGIKKRDGSSTSRRVDRSAEAPRAAGRAAKRLARESSQPDVAQASVRTARLGVARAAGPTYVARRGGGLERVLDDFSQSGADYLRERTYRVSGGYLVERTTRYGSQYVLERTLKPTPW